MDKDKLALLGNFNDLEADIVEALLREMDIPVLKKYPDSGGYMEIYSGLSHSGVSLYVPARELERAREVVANHSSQSVCPEEEETGVEMEVGDSSNSILDIFRWIARIAIAAFFLYHLITYLLGVFKN